MATKILITVCKDAMRRNILETGFMDALLAEPSVRVVLVVEPDRVTEYEEQFGSDRVAIVGFEKEEQGGMHALVSFLLRTGINSHSLRTYRNRALARGKASRLSHYAKALISNTLGRSTLFISLIRSWYEGQKAPQSVYKIFDEHQPNVVFMLSGINRDFDSEFGRVAKQRNIKLLGMVRSWDNLNNHGILPVVPEVWYFQNQFLMEMATKLQRINLEEIKTAVVGLPHYDAYHTTNLSVLDRETFIQEAGLDPAKKLILLGGSDFYYTEDKLPRILNDAIEAGKVTEPVQIIFRPHPSRLFPLEAYGLDELPHVTLNDAFSGKVNFTDTDFFINLLYHADIIINIASTLSIDAAVFERPAICINFDAEDRLLSHFESVHRLYDHFDHYERLVATGGVRTPESPEALVSDINDYLQDPSLDQDGRKKIIDTFVAPFDGRSSGRLGELVAADIRNQK